MRYKPVKFQKQLYTVDNWFELLFKSSSCLCSWYSIHEL